MHQHSPELDRPPTAMEQHLRQMLEHTASTPEGDHYRHTFAPAPVPGFRKADDPRIPPALQQQAQAIAQRRAALRGLRAQRRR